MDDICWFHANFSTIRPIAALPRLLHIAGEERANPSYHHEGRLRQKETQCVFQYTLSGKGIFRDASGEHEVPPGHGFLCRIKDPETSYYYPEFAVEPWRFLFCCFDGEYAQALVAELCHRYGPVYALPSNGPAARRLLAWSSRHADKLEISAAEGAGIVMELLLALSASKECTQKDSPRSEMVRRARLLVESEEGRLLNVKELAKALRVSREYLCRAFAIEAGATPHNYILRQRMLAACHMLKEETDSVKEIAASLGYKVPAHFHRAFVREIGMTPGMFRLSGIMPIA